MNTRAAAMSDSTLNFSTADVWSARTIRKMIPIYARPDEEKFKADVLKRMKKLRECVAIKNEGVVHGRGLVATRDQEERLACRPHSLRTLRRQELLRMKLVGVG